MKFTSFSRRKMLAAFAAAGGAARLGPFMPSAVFAGSAPKRILTVFHPMGYAERTFFPKGTQTDFTLGETMTALDPWKNKLIFIDGLNCYGMGYFFGFPDNEHGCGAGICFTGAKFGASGATGASIDQAVADFQYAQVKTPYRALALGVNCGSPSPHTGVFYRSAGTPVAAQENASATFDMLFTGFTPSKPPPSTGGGAQTPSSPTPSTTPDKPVARRQSILNLVKGDLGRLRSLAGKDDKMKLDAHLEGISSIENRLKLSSGQSTNITPSSPTAPIAAAGSVTDGCVKPTFSNENLEDRVHAQMDLITAAFACDLTRHASLQLGICDGGMDAVPGVNQHDMAHSFANFPATQTSLDNHKKYDRWFAARWAYLLGKLDSIKEGNGTMLDNTLIMFGQDTTTNTEGGAVGFGPHYSLRFPIFLAGGGNFAFKTGQYIKLPITSGQPTSIPDLQKWVSHQRVLTSVGQAFGLNIDSFGDNDPGKGPLSQLTRV